MGIFKNLFRKKSIATGDLLPPVSMPTQGSNYLFNWLGTNKIYFNDYAIDLQANHKLIEKFNTLGEIAAPILKHAESARYVIPELFIKQASGKLKLVNDKHPMYSMIEKFWTKYVDLLVIQKLLLGNVYISVLNYGTIETGMIPMPQEFILLPPQNTLIKITKPVDFRSPEILSYDVIFDEYNLKYEFEPENTLHIKQNNPLYKNNAYLYGISKLVSASKNIRSLESGYGAKVGLYENGPAIIITGKTQGEFASMNMQSEESVNQVQERFNKKYGLQENQYRIMATDIPLDVKTISMDFGQLQLNENNTRDFERICSLFDVDPLVIGASSGSTFSNKESAERNFYNGSFRRNIEDIISNLTTFIQRFDPSLVIKPSYVNISQIIEEQKKWDDQLLSLTEKGLMTRNQYLEETGWASVNIPEFNEFATLINGAWSNVIPDKLNEGDTLETVSQEQLQAQANLRGTVGGVQGILAIQASVAQGTTDYAAALATLIEIYGFSEATAITILGTPGINVNNNIQEYETEQNI